MQKTVEAAQVDEGAKAGEALYHALDRVADLNALEEGLPALIGFFLEPPAAIEDDVNLLFGVKPFEIKAAREADVLGAVLDTLDIGLGRGKEALEPVTEVDFESALHFLVDLSLYGLMLLESVGHGFPENFFLGPLLGYDHFARVGLFLDQYYLDIVADLGWRVAELD